MLGGALFDPWPDDPYKDDPLRANVWNPIAFPKESHDGLLYLDLIIERRRKLLPLGVGSRFILSMHEGQRYPE